MQQMTDEVRAEPGLDGASVMLPGGPQITYSKERIKYGIPIDDSTLEALSSMSVKNNVKLILFKDFIKYG